MRIGHIGVHWELVAFLEVVKLRELVISNKGTLEELILVEMVMLGEWVELRIL